MRIKTFSKVNYTLEVGAKREDGYHNLESITQTLSLCDYIDIEDEERDDWNNIPDEFSRRMSDALENDSYYDDYDTDGQYFDF